MPKILDNIDALRARKAAYQQTFNSMVGQQVLDDLAEFCCAWTTCFNKDARLHAVAEGRREVFLRIAHHLHLTTDQLFQLFQGQHVQLNQEETYE